MQVELLIVIFGSSVKVAITQKPDPGYNIEKKFRAPYTFKYNPIAGYEPYWMDGEHVIRDRAETTRRAPRPPTRRGVLPRRPTTSTKAPPTVCDVPCQDTYLKIKHVCTHHTGSTKMKGCWRPRAHYQCPGDPPDTFVDPFYEFPTYCEFLEATCRTTHKDERYVLLHVGKCHTVDYWFKDMHFEKNIPKRLSLYPLLVQWTTRFPKR